MRTNPRDAKVVSISSAHLTEVQFGELLDGTTHEIEGPLTPAEEHLVSCEECTAELETLREALVLFHDASTAYANAQLRDVPPVRLPKRPVMLRILRPAYFAAAAALLLAVLLPMEMLHQRSRQTAAPQATNAGTTSVQHYATESDEALLEDVDNATAASVPDSMQALADPTAGSNISVRKSVQRKD